MSSNINLEEKTNEQIKTNTNNKQMEKSSLKTKLKSNLKVKTKSKSQKGLADLLEVDDSPPETPIEEDN